MAKPRKGEESRMARRKPATTPDGRENQLISLAIDLAEKQLLDGTASAQVITHYLKLGTTRETLEREKLQQENALLRAKAETYSSQANMEQLYKDALDAMSSYKGEYVEKGDDFYED